MAEVTESFEARMFASMKRGQEDDLEDVTLPTLQETKVPASHPQPHPPPRTSLGAGGGGGGGGGKVRTSHHQYESPYTTSDDDTSFSTWKAPVSLVRLVDLTAFPLTLFCCLLFFCS
jgi:hypothetical protein